MPSDSELLERWSGGDPRAGEDLFSRHFDSIFRFFFHRVRDEAEELVQKTFLAALDARTRFRGDASFRTFLFAIARRQLLKFFESRTRQGKLTFQTLSLVDLGASVETRLANSQLQARLLEHMRALPVDHQMALELHYWEGLKIQEVAEVLDAPPGSVKRWMHDARRSLADSLALDERTLALGPRPSHPA